MSMLSDPRQKQHYVLQPKGKPLWSDGSESFGTKMLEKMGWTKGKGLGKNLTGSQDFIRVTYKKDIKGLGFDEKSDQWTDHEKQFSSLLNSLNTDKEVNDEKHNDVKTNIKRSLEENSKNSKARVHYKKFTKAKDISQYSEKDLATIFGKKSLQDSSTIQIDSKTEENNENSIHALPIITSKANIHEYFKKKMSEIQILKKNGNEKDKEGKNSKSKKRKYSDNNDTNPEIVNQTIQNNDENRNERKKKKKNKNDEGNKHKEISEIKEDIVKIDEDSFKEKSKIKRKKRSHNNLEQTETHIQETEECLSNKVDRNYNSAKLTENDIKFCPVDKPKFNSENLEINHNNESEEKKPKKKSRKIKSEEIISLDEAEKVHKKKKLKDVDSNLIYKGREKNCYDQLEIVEDIVEQDNEKLTSKEKNKLKHKKNCNNFLKGTEGIEECFSQNKNDLEDTKLEEVDPIYEKQTLNICENFKEYKNDESQEKGNKKKTKKKKDKSFEELVTVESGRDICKSFKISQNDLCEENGIKKKTKKRKDKSFKDIVDVETEKDLAADITKKKVDKSIEADFTTKKEILNSDDAEYEKPKMKTKNKKYKESNNKNINENEDLILNDEEKSSILENVKAVELVDPDNIEINEISKNKKSYTKSKTEQNHFEKSVENEKDLVNVNSKILINETAAKNIKNEIVENKKKKKLVMSVKFENSDSSIVEESNENDIELDTLTITKFSAEKFRMTNLDGFPGSNFKLIQGYGLQKNLEINVIETFFCSDLITKFWDIENNVHDSTICDKYKSETAREYEYKNKVIQARKMNQKVPTRNVKYLKKKSAFTHVIV